jgi:hypothetical protein
LKEHPEAFANIDEEYQEESELCFREQRTKNFKEQIQEVISNPISSVDDVVGIVLKSAGRVTVYFDEVSFD